MSVRINVEHCGECPHMKAKRHYTADSFKTVYDHYCTKAKDRTISIDEDVTRLIPEWCPLRRERGGTRKPNTMVLTPRQIGLLARAIAEALLETREEPYPEESLDDPWVKAAKAKVDEHPGLPSWEKLDEEESDCDSPPWGTCLTIVGLAGVIEQHLLPNPEDVESWEQFG